MASSRPERIVVIDDTDLVQKVVSRQLERLGFTVIGAADGVEGLAAIRADPPDLVLCDLRMPRLDGLELLSVVRREAPELPVIVMSGAGLLGDAIGALKLGAADYITKPVDANALEHAVRKALELAALVRENKRYRRELEMLNQELRAGLRLLAEDEAAGRQIQFRMLPRNHLRFGRYLLTRELIPSQFLSGDFIDAFRIDQDHFGFYLADVAGHGVASALVTVLLRTFVQRQLASYEHTGDSMILSPARLLMRLNDDVARDDLGKHLTIFYGIVDLRADTLSYATAGHFPWPVLYDGRTAKVLEHPGVPVGMLAGTRYDEHHASLGAGHCLSLFSDGLLEALPQATVRDKLAFLREYFGRVDVSVESARADLHLGAPATLPDDVALLIIRRGSDHERASAA